MRIDIIHCDFQKTNLHVPNQARNDERYNGLNKEKRSSSSTLSTITALAIPTTAPNKDVAWDFVKFVSGEKGAEVMASTGNIPAMTNDKIVDLIAGMEGFPTDEASKEALVTSHTYLEMPANDKSSEIEAVLNEQHDLIMNEEIGVDDAIAAMNEGVQAIIGQ